MKPLTNPMQHELVKNPFTHDKGWVTVPREPGLGVEVDEQILQKYRFD
jgi:L-alanine-DL-glutamate epimerase-like enolase superfamily enzyme